MPSLMVTYKVNLVLFCFGGCVTSAHHLFCLHKGAVCVCVHDLILFILFMSNAHVRPVAIFNV